MTNVIPRAIADVELQVASAISPGTTSFTLNSANDDDGNALPAGLYCFTLDSGTSNKEYLIGQLNGVNITSVKSVSRQGVETTGAARAHRIGAPCIVTNFATLQRVADILRGALDLDGASPIAYDAEPTLSDREQLATVGYVLDNVTGGTVSFDRQTVTGTGGATIVAGNLIYFDEADQEWKLCDADTAATVEGVMRGLALGAGSDGVAITGGVLLGGVYTTTGLTAGAIYYASNTAGALSTSAGTTKHIVGVALSTTRLWVIPQHRETIPTRTKDALAGGGDFGTPSTSNKFVTENFFDFATTVDVQEFTSSGTWTKPSRGSFAVIEIIGGGGSGAATKASAGGNQATASAGSGGAYRKFIVSLTLLSATETVTIGAGGAAVNVTAAEGTVNGNNGAASWFKSTLLSANGGLGGLANLGGSSVGAVGGSRASDLITEKGADSSACSISAAGAGQSTIYAGASGGGSFATSTPNNGTGTGGTSLFTGSVGGNGASTSGTSGATATAGVRGGGGGSASVRNASGTATSGKGGDGFVRVTVF